MQNLNSTEKDIKQIAGNKDKDAIELSSTKFIPKQLKISIIKYKIAINSGIYFTNINVIL